MSRGSNPIKVQEWTKRLRRFERSNQTVADFCSGEAVSEPSFYYWKRRLAGTVRRKTGKGRRGSKQASKPTPRFQSVVLTAPEDVVSTRIRLPGGAVIELGQNIRINEKIVDQLLNHQGARGGGAC